MYPPQLGRSLDFLIGFGHGYQAAWLSHPLFGLSSREQPTIHRTGGTSQILAAFVLDWGVGSR